MESLTFRLEHDHAQNDTASSPSPEMFSFPGTPTTELDPESEFEFGSCVITAPGSPTTPTRSTASPADQFFLNGRLLPHSFAPPPAQSGSRASFSGRENILSRGTSIGSSSISSSKDLSLLSSRSNSTNSHGDRGGGGSTCSTCSSGRTSSSEVSERRAFQKRIKSKGSFKEHRNVSGYAGNSNYNNQCSQRWQFITAAPMLGPSRSMRSGVGPTASPRKKKREEREGGNGKNKENNNNEGFLQRILRTFLETCMACHAMESQEKEFDLDNGSVLAN